MNVVRAPTCVSVIRVMMASMIDRPGSAREGSAESGVSPSANAVAAAAAVGSMLGMYASPWAHHNYSAFLPYSGNTDLALLSQMVSLRSGGSGVTLNSQLTRHWLHLCVKL